MESKTLHGIQTLAKFGKVLSTIVFICCLVGGILCVVGLASMVWVPGSIEFGGVTIHGLIEQTGKYSIGTCYAAMLVGAILCAAECVISKMAERYFVHELAAGTPFTFEGANELLRLGIVTASVSLGSFIVADIGYAIVNRLFENVADLPVQSAEQVGLGVALIIVSVIFRYGAEVKSTGTAS